jgi:hypothetical protein
MACQKCEGERIVNINAKCSDLCFASIGDKEKDGYVPDDMGVGGGDYVEFSMCLECGQVQGNFPLPKSRLEGR